MPQEIKGLLTVSSLSLSQHTTPLLRNLSFSLNKGETMGLVGESGSGKSLTAKTLMGLHSRFSMKAKGSIQFRGQELIDMDEKGFNHIRGKQMGMIFQNPLTSLNPTLCIGKQLLEGILMHEPLEYREAKSYAIDLLRRVGIADPERRFTQVPSQLSGGMRQRVMIAMAIACRPSLLIADEPTTSLDLTTQAQILTLLRDIKEETGSALLMISHDLGVIAKMCDTVCVMRQGEIVEKGPVEQILICPSHPYTIQLMEQT